eukprot:scaffold198078_cov27-Tisochrysis_lutea.AAC.1
MARGTEAENRLTTSGSMFSMPKPRGHVCAPRFLLSHTAPVTLRLNEKSTSPVDNGGSSPPVAAGSWPGANTRF